MKNRVYDEIRIDNLEVYAGHGVFEEENRNGQSFFVNMVLYTDLSGAGRMDDLTLSTHYGEVCALIHDTLRKQNFQMIEAAAELCARKILLHFPHVQELELELRKPNAPIALPFESVSVRIHRGWKKVYLGVGSNMGDKRGYVMEALDKLKETPEIRGVNCSDLIETKPYGGVEQDCFLNGAVELETLLSAQELLKVLNQIEAEAGRERIIHWGPRTLDLDILFYEDEVIRSESLIIPHADMQNRTFVLMPLLELCPEKVHPIFGKTIWQLYEELKSKEENA